MNHPFGRNRLLARLHRRGLASFLGLCVAQLLVPPLAGAHAATAFAIVLSLLAVNALALLVRSRIETAVTAAFLLPLLTTVWAHVRVDEPIITKVWLAAAASFFAWTATLLLRAVLRPGPVDGERLGGALAAYFMVGFAGGFLHALVEQLQPGSYTGLTPGPTGAASDLMYFSFVTLTTTGYGDITPASGLARSLAMLQAILGLVYLGVVMARLVGRLDMPRDRDRPRV